VHRPSYLYRFALAFGLTLGSVAQAQIPGPNIVGHVYLDAKTGLRIRQDVVAHLDAWSSWTGIRLPGAAPVARQGQQMFLFPEVPTEVRMVCDGRAVASVPTHIFIAVSAVGGQTVDSGPLERGVRRAPPLR